ncbi:hypothetical protein N9B45_00550 [bacterium]|nr:hypothetical protein [bacterium]MDA7924403.1 hypothetical protein [Mariniblastus sp.]MDB4357523.1 hypothetical protein [Mariniblastus sp.]
MDQLVFFQDKEVPALLKFNWLAVLCFVGLSQTLGCGSNQVPTHTIEGIVQFEDGSPLMFGNIEFYSAEHKLNARGKINRDGTFTVGTYSESDGAVAGEQQIAILQISGNYLTEKLNDQINHDHGHLIDQAHGDYRTSGLAFVVEPGVNRIELTVRKRRQQTSEGMPKH